MQKIDYGFMDRSGYFLRLAASEHDPDNAGDGYDYSFILDADHPIYETDDPAAILDTMIGYQNGRYLSKDGQFGGLPSKYRININDFVPVAFIREMKSVIDGGERIAASMTVRLARFADTSDPESVWLDDVENILDTTGLKR